MKIRFGLSLLCILGAGAASSAQAQETAAQDLLRTAIATACRLPDAPAADLAEAFGGMATEESDRANHGSPVTLSTGHVRLGNGAPATASGSSDLIGQASFFFMRFVARIAGDSRILPAILGNLGGFSRKPVPLSLIGSH